MTDTTIRDTSLTIRQTFDATPERMFHVFTEPDKLEQWFVPEGMTAQVHTLEPAPYGAFTVSWFSGESRINNKGTFVEVVENERLSWVEDTDEGESRVTVDFQDVNSGTEVILTHQLPDPEIVNEAAEGWAYLLENIENILQ